MDVSRIAAAATELAETRTGQAVQLAVLRKAMDLQAQGALQLLQTAMPAQSPSSNPPHLGNRVDTFV